jgi:glyoxylase-like metal-dependent hydrolase (beta-lactamase superfamily II)
MSNKSQSYFAGSGASRRDLMKGGLALAAVTFFPGGVRPVLAQAAPHTFKIGACEVTVLSDGNLSMPFAFSMPGRDPQEIEDLFRAAGLPTDGITAQVNVTIVKTPDALILIDTGGGSDFVPSVGKLADRLDLAGFAPDAFTHVIFTHAHADHLWGVIDPLDGGTKFTNAKHIMTGGEFDFWSKPGREADVPDMFKTMAIGTGRRLKAVAERMEQRKAGDEITPGVSLVDSAGHTPGHVCVQVTSGQDRLMVSGDALNHSLVSFANPGWRWGSDMDSDAAIMTRKRLLDQLATDKIALLGYHLPWPGLGRVERAGTAYRFVQG